MLFASRNFKGVLLLVILSAALLFGLNFARAPTSAAVLKFTTDLHNHVSRVNIQPLKNGIPSEELRDRYGPPEVWRSDGLFNKTVPDREGLKVQRPAQRPRSEFDTAKDYLEQTLVADYPSELMDDIFVMIKSGGTVMWQRLPIHFVTTLTRVKKFALYSDLAGSIGGHEIIDILKDLPPHVIEHEQLASYRIMRDAHRKGYRWDPSDIDFHSRNDGWNNDKFKNLPMLADAYKKSPDSKWFVFMDADTFIFWDNLAQYLSTLNHSQPWYFGNLAFMGYKEHHGKNATWFAHGGSGVVISKETMDRAFGPKKTEETKHFLDHWADTALGVCCGDMLVAWALFEVTDTIFDPFRSDMPYWRFQKDPITSLRFFPEMFCEPVMSFHHLKSGDIETLWQYERLRPAGSPILYADLYRDFVLPYIVEELEDWQIAFTKDCEETFTEEQNLTFTNDDGLILSAHASKEGCQLACQNKYECLAWSFWEGTCKMGKGCFFLGEASTQDVKSHGCFSRPPSKVYSGWMVDRIRQLRVQAACDPLRIDAVTGLFNDSPETSEGWASR